MEVVEQSTALGTLAGQLEDGLRIFRGVPYAEPLVGLGRVRRPEPVKPWSGTREAFQFGPAAAQESIPMLDSGPIGDACLSLNIWAPADTTALPVMVWIHGGGFLVGSSAQSLYEASRLARENGVVVVSLNYRLGAPGFGYWADFPELQADSNNGLRDQILALEWVRDHISNFGGDPARVTIFGESAGGMSVASLLASPKASGLFQRAIVQSGSADHALIPEQARRIAQVFAQAAGDVHACLTGDLKGIVAAQRPCTQDVVARGLHPLPVLQAAMTLMPVIGDDILPQHPIQALAAGASADIPLLIGTNANEWELFHHLPQVIGMSGGSNDAYAGFMPGRGEAILANYRTHMPAAGEDQIVCAYESDRVFNIPTIRLLEARQGAGAPSWTYQFDWPCPAMPMLKSCHVMDIPFVFGNTGSPSGMFFTGGSPAAAQLSGDVRAAWTRFAHGEAPAAPGFPAWPAYTLPERATLRIAAESVVINDPDADRREAWTGVI